MVETVSKNVDSSLSVISKTSTYLLGTTEVQNYLQDVNHAEYAILFKQLRNSLYLTMESMPLASSILVMRPSGTYEGAARYALPSIEMESPQDAFNDMVGFQFRSIRYFLDPLPRRPPCRSAPVC